MKSTGTSTLFLIAKLAERGDLKVIIARTYPVEEARAALAEVQQGKVRGKVVLTF